MTEFVKADPTTAEDALNNVLNVGKIEEPKSGVAYTDLPDTHVTLPGGYVTDDGDLVREAEVRELNGYDEEAIARAGSTAKIMLTLLQRAVVKIGDEKASADILNSLLAADRDSLLLAIRRVTFGNVLDGKVTCTSCGIEQDVSIDLTTDVENKVLENAGDRDFTVTLANGEAKVTLPTGLVQRIISNAGDKSMAELNTMLLRGCVLSINGMPVFKDEQIKGLSIRDRETILTELSERNPGPRLHEVKKPCSSCEQEIEMPLTLASLFRL
ncbi:MAG: hypothetical protein EBY26_03840 [Microbacteriaceae bacterium]|nr:hypothetical protein [Microbacteriaceae bacterium]